MSFNPRARVGRDHQHIFHPSNNLFQSTRPRGARQLEPVYGYLSVVSIHAPAWGATTEALVEREADGFNPRARVGRDVASLTKQKFWTFQSTRPRGARL